MSFWNIYQGKKILVTGDTGFKGSWLCIWLHHLGAEVYGYALPAISDMDNFVRTGLAHHIDHRDGDVRNGPELKRYFHEIQPDIAFHLAAQPIVLQSYQDPVGTFETNLMGVVHFLEAVRATASVQVAINVTSDKCYQNNEWVWGYRENDPMGGKDPYSASKGCSELITSSYQHSFFMETGCRIASVRAGNVIGGGDWAADRIVPDYFRAVKNNEKIMIRNPFATRPWQHVLEPLSGYMTLAAKLWTDGSAYCGGWNFGPEDHTNYSVQELIEEILSLDPRGGYLTPEVAVKPHEAVLLKLDIAKAVNQLAWKPVLDFKQTVRFTVDGYQSDLTQEESLFDRRVKQISDYAAQARALKIPWSV